MDIRLRDQHKILNMNPVIIDKAILYGYSGGMALYISNWNDYVTLFSKSILTHEK